MSTAPVTPAPIEIKLDDGTVAKGATWEEVAQNLAKMKVDTANAYKGEKEKAAQASQELERLRQEDASRQRQAAADAQRTRDEAARAAGQKVFDRQKFVNLLNDESDPEAAARAMDLWWQHRFQQTPDETMQQFQYQGEKITQYEQERIAGMFMAMHPDYPAGDNKASIAMRTRAEDLLKQGFPYDARTLDTAFREAVAAGEIKPVEKKPDSQQQQADNLPNPSLSGAGAGGGSPDEAASDEARLWAMPMDQLEAELRRRGTLK